MQFGVARMYTGSKHPFGLSLSKKTHEITKNAAHEHLEIQKTLKRFIDAEINPHVDEWEAAEIFPAHEVFKKLGNLGLLGLTKPEEYGGAGLDYSYSWPWPRRWATSTAAACPWPSACRPTCARRRWRASAATSSSANSWRPPLPATPWAASA
jgi:alkylation response protein AidB-like acyl-CoA dehydrogenase